ncbi:MAG: site-specific integrase [Verrucomicrobiota bacterium]
MPKQTKTWISCGFRNLYRHKSGTYYLRISSGSKPSWKSLETKLKSVAVARLDEERKELMASREAAAGARLNENTTMGDLIAVRLEQIANETDIKASTADYWKEIFEAFLRSWKGIESRTAKSIKPVECQRWAKRFSEGYSASRFNNTLDGLRKMFAIAIEGGLRFKDPTAGISRRRPKKKDLSSRLPSLQQFREWVDKMRKGEHRLSGPSADLVELLAFTGMRIGEAKHLVWAHCDFERGQVVVAGDPEDGTKNHEIRRIPMISDARALLERMRMNSEEEPYSPVCRVTDARGTMRRACDEMGMELLTHHDMRHFFATICIESGVDVPTVAKWLGHKDGGALAMKTYGHLRDEHSQAAAQKVSFNA